MENEEDFTRFKNLTFDDFKTMATDTTLSKYQKIGFPDSYRRKKEKLIFQDIVKKLEIDPQQRGLTILDIGPGCSDLPRLMINYCSRLDYNILLADCSEMLELLPDRKNISKYAGYFPDETGSLIEEYKEKVDYIICYSTLQVAYYKTCIFKFIDSALSLLRPGGKMLIGDIPNFSKRRRFFSTEKGIRFHQEFTGTTSIPDVDHFKLEPTQIDDGWVFGILHRYRNYGYDTYVLPQGPNLPMANRREDILIYKI